MSKNGAETPRDDAAPVSLPRGVKTAAAWSWRLLVIAAAIAGFVWIIVQLRIIVIPVLIAVLFTALLAPLVGRLMMFGWPKWLSVLSALLVLFAAVAALAFLIVTQLRSFSGSFVSRSEQAYTDFVNWLAESPLHINQDQIDEFVSSIVTAIERDSSTLWSGALSVGITVGHVVAGALLTIFSLIFLLIDGPRIWRWILRLVPSRGRAAFDGAGRAGWVSVGHYVRIQIFVAFVDAVGIGVGAAILQVPLAIPIAVLVFLGAFVPFLGTIAAGSIATFIALIYNGPVNALIMLAIVILVNQIEGHILQPLVMGNAVRVHPLAVVLAVSSGALVAGIPGALFAVPLVASLNSMAKYISSNVWRGKRDPLSVSAETWMAEAAAEAKAELAAEGAKSALRSETKDAQNPGEEAK